MKFINLTPHTIKITDGQNNGPWYPASGQVARVQVTRQTVLILEDEKEPWHSTRIYSPSFGEVEGLPEKQPGVMLIVSALVRNALPDRDDLVSPGNLVRNEHGEVIGCDGFDSNYPLI